MGTRIDILTASALAGLLAGAACGGEAETPAPTDGAKTEKAAKGKKADAKHAKGKKGKGKHVMGGKAKGEKHACRGQNKCKGQGGCHVAGQNDCAGKNPCEGKGGCKTG